MVDFPAPGTRLSTGGSLSRRSLMTAGAVGVAGLLVSGCSVNNPISDDTSPEAPTELAPDVAVATTALAEITVVRSAVHDTLTRFPATRAQLTPFVQMHQAHEVSLADAVPDQAKKGASKKGASAAPAPYVVPRQRNVALRRLLAREQRLHDTLDGLALRAQSGDFARLLASMGAAVSQQLAVEAS